MDAAQQPRIETRTGAAILPVLPAVARLRISVFRAWPYLYEGDPEYEARYLQIYVDSPGAAIIVALDGGQPVGASTCIPLAHEGADITAAFSARGWDLDRFFYFGESVLAPDRRGQGIGVAFFAAREAHARAVSAADFACFCAVQRDAAHPARPADYVPLDAFWSRRGYVRRPDLTCTMRWREVGQREESEHLLGFWMKSLTGAALP